MRPNGGKGHHLLRAGFLGLLAAHSTAPGDIAAGRGCVVRRRELVVDEPAENALDWYATATTLRWGYLTTRCSERGLPNGGSGAPIELWTGVAVAGCAASSDVAAAVDVSDP